MELTVTKTLKELDALRHATQEHDQLLALRHELQIANVIQQSILPRSFPPFPERTDIDVFAAMLPAREVGGDFYDFFLVDHDHRLASAFIGLSIGGACIAIGLVFLAIRAWKTRLWSLPWRVHYALVALAALITASALSSLLF